MNELDLVFCFYKSLDFMGAVQLGGLWKPNRWSIASDVYPLNSSFLVFKITYPGHQCQQQEPQLGAIAHHCG